MANGQSEAVLSVSQVVVDAGTVAGVSDGQLLARFNAHRDELAEIAFTALVRRHGPMVLRVCRQVLGDWHTADDAFQATFLILARRAGSIRRPDLLGHWLYGVASRTARTARVRNERKRRRESSGRGGHERLPIDDVHRPELSLVSREELEALHEEVSRLPERYRVPVVLCELEGLTYHEAALRLRCPVSTIGVRLKRARERLRLRLTQRGLAPTAGLIGALSRRGIGFSVDASGAGRCHRPGRNAVRGEQGRRERFGLGGGHRPDRRDPQEHGPGAPQAGGEPGAGRRDRRHARLVRRATRNTGPGRGGASQVPAHGGDAAPGRFRPLQPLPLKRTFPRGGSPDRVRRGDARSALPLEPEKAGRISTRMRQGPQEQAGNRRGARQGALCQGLDAERSQEPRWRRAGTGLQRDLVRGLSWPGRSRRSRTREQERGPRHGEPHGPGQGQGPGSDPSRFSRRAQHRPPSIWDGSPVLSWRRRFYNSRRDDSTNRPSNDGEDSVAAQIQGVQQQTTLDRRLHDRSVSLQPADGVTLSVSQRNTPALFGAGRIDAISSDVLAAVAAHQPAEVRGRISRTPDGRVGRFGWKAQIASLGEFIRAACANELGLEVPGHSQAISPLAPSPEGEGTGYDRGGV